MDQQTESADVASLHIPDEYRAWPIRKDRYSIWSLLVITTLLALWMAVPRRSEVMTLLSAARMFFLLLHQLALLTLVVCLCSTIFGNRRLVICVFGTIAIVVWGPLFGIVTEELLARNGGYMTCGLLDALGVRERYLSLYGFISRNFGYEPPY